MTPEDKIMKAVFGKTLEEIIKKALLRANLAKEDEEAFTAVETPDGMVVKIWYRCIGDDNVLVRYEVVTLEQWEWERHGCSNNAEWHRYLNKQMWRDYNAGVVKE